MPTFDPSTDYANDWQYFDFTETAQFFPNNEDLTILNPDYRTSFSGLILREGDITRPEFVGLSVGLTLVAAQTAAFLLWNPTVYDFDPRSRDIVQRADASQWIIQSVGQSPFGRWNVLAYPVPENE